MKILRYFLVILLLTGAAFSQASFVGGVALGSTFTSGIQVAQILPNATLYVCLYSAPSCDAAHQTTVYTDSTAVTPLTQPLTSDARGNFGFWATGGNYQFVIAYRGNSYGPFAATVQANDGAVVHNTGNETIAGNKTFTGSTTLQNVTILGSVLGAVTFGSTGGFAGAVTAPTFISTVGSGTSPLTVTSNTKVNNLNADLLDGNDWNTPAALGATTPNTVNATAYTTYNIPRFLFVTSDFTVAANTNLQTITGLTWTLPANTPLSVPFTCHLMYSQATAAVADQFGIQAATIAPTNIAAKGQVWTSASAVTAGNLPSLTTTTATAIVTFTPSAAATVFNAELSGLIENPTNVSTNVINVMVQTSNSADLVTIKRGSFCRIF